MTIYKRKKRCVMQCVQERSENECIGFVFEPEGCYLASERQDVNRTVRKGFAPRG